MNFGNCKCCNAIIKYDEIPLCNDCLNKYYIKVREFIYEHGESSPYEINAATNVPIKVIDYFIRSGSLYDINEDTISEEEIERKKNLASLKELRDIIGRSKEEKKADSSTKAGMHFINYR